MARGQTRATARASSPRHAGHSSCSLPRAVSHAVPSFEPDERERAMIEAVVQLAKALREERDRLAVRLEQLEREIAVLVAQVESCGEPVRPAPSLRQE